MELTSELHATTAILVGTYRLSAIKYGTRWAPEAVRILGIEPQFL
jgi:hypothetical protein